MELHHKHRGFTLVELLVVIAIVGILVALLFPAIQAVRESARMMQCKNNLKQLGLALHLYHDTHQRLPAGWVADAHEPEGDPGWAWGTSLLPYIEEGANLPSDFDSKKPIRYANNQTLRETPIRIFICPSEPLADQFWLPEDSGHSHSHEDDHDHEEHDEHEDHEEHEDHDPEHAGHYDEGEPLLLVARANYVGMFGTEEIEEHPSEGDGVFYHNSQNGFKNITDGLSKTIFLGERSSRLGSSTWVGNVHGAMESMARIVGSADHAPNARGGHFEDFSSRHPQGAHFLLGDGGVKLIGDSIDEEVYRAMATRAGNEVVSLE